MTRHDEAGERPRRTPAQIQRDVDDEIRFHLDRRGEALEASGLDRAAARAEAERRFGDVGATRRAVIAIDRGRERTAERREFVQEFMHDLRLGFRQLAARPTFACAAIVTLAIGIGATTTIFGAADHVLLRPLPYRDAERVVTLWESDRATGAMTQEVSPGNFVDWQRMSTSFESMGIAEPSGFDLTGDGPPQPIAAWRVSRGFFEALGVSPVRGRTFVADEYEPGASPVVLISEGLWQRRFASDPAIVGRSISVDGAPATVVGVLPSQLEYPEPKELWTPKAYRDDELTDRSSAYMRVVARIRPGVTVEAARADLDRVAAALARDYPQTNATLGVTTLPLEQRVLGPVRPALWALLGAVGLMLLIACANVAGLLLVRGSERESEFAVRAAIGAHPGRLIRQLLAENVALGLIAGAAGVGLAMWGTQALVALSPPGLPRVGTLAVDGRVLAFAVSITLIAALAIGTFPALRFSRPGLVGALGSGGRTTGGKARARLRSGLVVGEIAVALVLLAGAGLLVRSFVALASNDVGFARDHRVSLQLFLWDRNPTPAQRLQRVDQLTARFQSTPGVEAVGLVSALPFHPSQIDPRSELKVEGAELPATQRSPEVYTTIASPEYFRVMAVPVRRGRPFDPRDRMESPRVALVNETLARRWFPGQDPIGKRVTIGVMDAPESREIVGIVGDVRPTTLDSEPRAELFIPFAQSANGSVTFVVRARGNAGSLVPALRQAVWQVDPGQSIYHAATVEQLISTTLIERRFHLLLFGLFSIVALVLAAVGVYALVNATTAQRTHEIGVRMALGARPADIVRLILSQGVRLVVPGVALGIAGALLLTRFLAHMLYAVKPTDAVTFTEVAVVMALVALAGTLGPALRAAGVDPMRALRKE